MSDLNEQQRAFLEQLAGRIPRLFEAIAAGNVRAEFIVGLRRVGRRHVRLKLVAEVVDPGANPLGTHGAMPGRLNPPASSSARPPVPAGLRIGVAAIADGMEASGPDLRERKSRARAVRNSDTPPDTSAGS